MYCIDFGRLVWRQCNSNMGGKLVTTTASGLKADTVVMQVGTEKVTADEYLYWLTSVCDSMYQYYGITDWNMMMTEDMTVGEYAKEEALIMRRSMRQFCSLRRNAASS